MANYQSSGQYEMMRSVIMTNTTNVIELDVRQTMVDAIVYESIYTNCITGTITLIDTHNLVQKYALGYGETIELEWKTVATTESIFVRGIVYDITETDGVNTHTNGYVLHFASPEYIAGSRDKLFSGYIDSPSNISKKLFNRINTQNKDIDIQESFGIEHIVFSGQTVIQGIQMCCDRAVSKENDHGYIFYESNQAFNIKSIESLYDQEPVTEFVFKDSAVYDNVHNFTEEMFNTIQNYTILPRNKYIEDVVDGQYGLSTASLSLYDKSLNIYNYNANSSGKSLAANKLANNNVLNSQFSDKFVLNYSHEHKQSEPHTHVNRMKLLKSNSFSVAIGVHGNSMLKVGDTAVSKIPTHSSNDGDNTEIDVHSGKFLIAEIKHILGIDNYAQSIKLIKDSFEEVVA